MILVPAFDAPVMHCDIVALGRVFGEEEKFRKLKMENFSANDLWFARV
ncbi:hypothetical protein [Streptomyces sp. SYP-A7193]|nr:hypothetical protein [Streptomyces sp. SYP-A7193]